MGSKSRFLGLILIAAAMHAADGPATDWAEKHADYSAVKAVLTRAEARVRGDTATAGAGELAVFDGRLYGVVGGIYFDGEGKAWQPIVVTTTAYVPCTEQCDDDPDITATGTNAFRTYGIAADPSAIAYGTVLRVPEYGDAKVDDTGGAMRQDWKKGIVHLDLRIPLRRHDGVWRSEGACNRVALQHGVQKNRIVLRGVPALDASTVVASAK
jgi:3D (Asp-Asp-Asp) domain-containing protein